MVNEQEMVVAQREAWLAARRQYVTGTDVPKLMGVSPWGGPTSVWLAKKGLDAASPETERQRWGRRLEEAILGEYAERQGVAVALADPYDLRAGVLPAHRRLAVSLDGWVMDALDDRIGRVVDAKNIGRRDPQVWGEEGSDQIPDYYALQLHTQMLVTGATSADLAVLFGGNEMGIYRVHADAEIATRIVEVADDFWRRYVEQGVQPPPDGSTAYDEHLAKRLRQQGEAIVAADEEALGWAAVLHEAEVKLDALEQTKREAQQYLKEKIGEAAGLAGPGFRVTWKKANDTTKIDYAEALADVRAWLAPVIDTVNTADVIKEIEAAIARRTSIKEGSRRFLPKWTATKDAEQ